jgi:hypothetical protein
MVLKSINLDRESVDFLSNAPRSFNLSNFVRTKLHELIEFEKESATNVANQTVKC